MKNKKKYQQPIIGCIVIQMESSIASGSELTFHTEGTQGEVGIADWKTEEEKYDAWF